MRALLIGQRQLQEKPIRYYLLAEDCGSFTESYGVRIEHDSEEAAIPGITMSQVKIQLLMETLINGIVTPVGLRDVVEDWLLA